ncbi:hypothetical protein Zm00014a_016126 [Zea mays]|uniref:Uncharacterized protein n=1 Tax=Zea mays TaxID=4577 RepID=A0A317Y3M7_MAIZE|nr:hypothetical protein Zm00014a_016126 [Zea mays]
MRLLAPLFVLPYVQ